MMKINNWEYATYSDKKYIKYLSCCVEGFKKITGIDLVVYCLDQDTVHYSRERGYLHRKLKPHPNIHVSSLEILKNSTAEVLLLIDADCWLLNVDIYRRAEEVMKKPDVAAAGDIGYFDMPYLFKGVQDSGTLLFEQLRILMQKYPKFFLAWVQAAPYKTNIFNTGCVVDIPFVYGGFAVYRPSFFHEIDVIEWIYSADLYLGIYILENNLRIENLGEYQYNRQIDSEHLVAHHAGPKPKDSKIESYCQDYMEYIRKR